MAETTIEWTSTRGPDGAVHSGYSFNAWVGCQEVSVGPQGACERCYARAWARRAGHPELWEGERRRTTEAYWKQPLKWNALSERLGVQLKVFCCSLADVFDNAVPAEWRRDLFRLIDSTPNLTWMLLTKRIGNAWDMIDEATEGYPPWRFQPWNNVWIGSTVVTQAEVDRDVPKLLRTPAAIRFLSCEPLMESLDFSGRFVDHADPSIHETWLEALDMVIAGGESGGRARPAQIEWFRSLQQQCAAVGTAYFMKQLGGVRDKRGRLEDLPEDLRVREWPAVKP